MAATPRNARLKKQFVIFDLVARQTHSPTTLNWRDTVSPLETLSRLRPSSFRVGPTVGIWLSLHPPPHCGFVFPVRLPELFRRTLLLWNDEMHGEPPDEKRNDNEWRQARQTYPTADQDAHHAQVHWVSANEEDPVRDQYARRLKWFDGRFAPFELGGRATAPRHHTQRA